MEAQRESEQDQVPALLLPTTMLPKRSRMSGSEVANARMAMISEDTVMSKPVSLQTSIVAVTCMGQLLCTCLVLSGQLIARCQSR